MAENNFKCTGNCMNCLPAQRAYCASQHAYSNMKVLDAVMLQLIDIKQAMTELSDKIETMKMDDNIFDPSAEREVAQIKDPQNNV